MARLGRIAGGVGAVFAVAALLPATTMAQITVTGPLTGPVASGGDGGAGGVSGGNGGNSVLGGNCLVASSNCGSPNNSTTTTTTNTNTGNTTTSVGNCVSNCSNGLVRSTVVTESASAGRTHVVVVGNRVFTAPTTVSGATSTVTGAPNTGGAALSGD
ncbi:MAG: hypothetical protein ABR564_00975 [Candidatus Dormibacteria bacterium]